MPSQTRNPGWLVARLLVAALVFGGIALYFQETLVRHALPLFQAWIGAIDDTYRTVALRLDRINGEWMIIRVAVPAVLHVLGGHVVAADPRSLMSTSVSAGIVLQPLVLAAALLCAWPATMFRELAWRFALAVPGIFLVLLLDVPMMLYGFLWNQELTALDPDRFSLLVSWADFMNAGGRFALTVFAVVVAVVSARALTQAAPRKPLPEKRPPSPPFPDPPAPPATALPDAPPSPPPAHAA